MVMMVIPPHTAIPRRVFRTKDDRVPLHDVVGVWRAIGAFRRVRLEPLEVPHQPLHAAQGLVSTREQSTEGAIGPQ